MLEYVAATLVTGNTECQKQTADKGNSLDFSAVNWGRIQVKNITTVTPKDDIDLTYQRSIVIQQQPKLLSRYFPEGW